MAITSASVQQKRSSPLDALKMASDAVSDMMKLFQQKKMIEQEQDKIALDRTKNKLAVLGNLYASFEGEFGTSLAWNGDEERGIMGFKNLFAEEFRELGMTNANVEAMLQSKVPWTAKSLDALATSDAAMSNDWGSLTGEDLNKAQENVAQVEARAGGAQTREEKELLKEGEPTTREVPGYVPQTAWEPAQASAIEKIAYAFAFKPTINVTDPVKANRSFEATVDKILNGEEVGGGRWVAGGIDEERKQEIRSRVLGRYNDWVKGKVPSTLTPEERAAFGQGALAPVAAGEKTVQNVIPVPPANVRANPEQLESWRLQLRDSYVNVHKLDPSLAEMWSREAAYPETPPDWWKAGEQPATAAQAEVTTPPLNPNDPRVRKMYFGQGEPTPAEVAVASKANSSIKSWVEAKTSGRKYTKGDADRMETNVKRYIEVAKRSGAGPTRESIRNYVASLGGGDYTNGIRRLWNANHTELLNAETAARGEARVGEKIFTIPAANQMGEDEAHLFRILGVEPGQKLNNDQMQTVISGFTALAATLFAQAAKTGSMAEIFKAIMPTTFEHMARVTEEAQKKFPADEKKQRAYIDAAMKTDTMFIGADKLFNAFMLSLPGAEQMFKDIGFNTTQPGWLGSIFGKKPVAGMELLVPTGGAPAKTEGQPGSTKKSEALVNKYNVWTTPSLQMRTEQRK